MFSFAKRSQFTKNCSLPRLHYAGLPRASVERGLDLLRLFEMWYHLQLLERGEWQRDP